MPQQINENNFIYDVAIIGSGPAALTAAIYAKKSNLSVALIEKDTPGGKMTKTEIIENYPAFEKINGPELAIKFFNHAINFGAKFIFGEVDKILNIKEKIKVIHLKNKNKIQTKFIIIATGTVEQIPNIPNINYYNNKGVTYCAICDGSLYKNKNVVVLGGGNAAVEESIFLTKVVKKVFLLVPENKFYANASAVEAAKKNKKIIYFLNAKITKLIGSEFLTGIETLINNKKKFFNNINALFPYIGNLPATQFIKEYKIIDKNGYIIVDKNMQTKINGIYAAGDVIQKNIRQISTAINDATIAIKNIINIIAN